VPKYLGYFERILARRKKSVGYLTGTQATYADLSLFQVVAGLRYAFPRAMTRIERKCRHVARLHDRIAQRPRIAAYLASDRRQAFNEDGIFRHYRELDA
jgi:glutathione S-transferase